MAGQYTRWPVVGGGGGSGTVTSVGLAAPAFLTVSGSPVTTSGTLTLTLATEAANTVFAGPATGADAQPTFRALVAADIPAFALLSPLTTKGDILGYSTTTARVPIGTNAQVLTADSTQALGLKWATPTTGTVTSVALTAPSILSVAGSPVTTTGTLALSLSTQTANTVWAGPTSGGAATPTFRSLVTADMPAGTGTVTSIALTMPATFSVSGSPVTTTGTLAASYVNQNANIVFAGPASGSAATPTFRALDVADVPGISAASHTGAYTLVAADKSSIVNFSGSTVTTFDLTAAATLGNGWWCYVRNSGTGSENNGQLVLDPAAAELIDGVATLTTYPGDFRLLRCTGTGWTTKLLHGGYVQYTTVGATTFTTPLGANVYRTKIWGGGSGGGGGRRGDAGALRAGGGGGGGGALNEATFIAGDLGSSVTVTIAATAAGGAGGASNNASGQNGTPGNNTTFGTLLTAYGAGLGGAGAAGTVLGGGGGGILSAGSAGTGGQPVPNVNGSAFGGGSDTADANGSASGMGGGSGGGAGSTIGRSGGCSGQGGAGGGGGGSVTAANASNAGGAGGSHVGAAAGGGALGAAGTTGVAGGNGGTATAGPTALGAGDGGGGGGAGFDNTGGGTASAAGGGSAGGIACGGGGGGASLSNNTAGAGGAGGSGLCRIWYFP